LLKDWDEVVIATGIKARIPEIVGGDHAKVVTYTEAINGMKPVGNKIAIIGAGGIGFDVAALMSHKGVSASLDVNVFAREWGIDFTIIHVAVCKESNRRSIPVVERFIYCSVKQRPWEKLWAKPPVGHTRLACYVKEWR
jgi:NAD(P)H-nitrite reductase large subunit